MVVAAEAAARAAGSNVAIAVVDANGDLVYFHRMDGAAGQAVTSSQGKARAAILFGVPTTVAAQAGAAGTALSLTLTPSGAAAQPLQIQQGGLPLIRNGQVIAGIGVGGAAPAQDEVFAQAGLDAVK
jgi:glc operon protein GlcG